MKLLLPTIICPPVITIQYDSTGSHSRDDSPNSYRVLSSSVQLSPKTLSEFNYTNACARVILRAKSTRLKRQGQVESVNISGKVFISFQVISWRVNCLVTVFQVYCLPLFQHIWSQDGIFHTLGLGKCSCHRGYVVQIARKWSGLEHSVFPCQSFWSSWSWVLLPCKHYSTEWKVCLVMQPSHQLCQLDF